MIKSVFLIFSLCFSVVTNSHAQDMVFFKKIYNEETAKIAIEHTQTLENIGKTYTNSLRNIQKKIQAEGELDKVKAILAELNRFQKEKSFPEKDTKSIDEILALAKFCNEKIALAEKSKANKIVSLSSKYDDALLRLQKEYTRSNDLEKATAVQEERKALESSETLKIAQACIASAEKDRVAQKKLPEAGQVVRLSSNKGDHPKDAKLFGGHYYKVFAEKRTWHDAKTECEKLKGHLATVSSELENQFLVKLANGQRSWLGATKENPDGKWKWVTDEKLTFQDWALSGNEGNNIDQDFLIIHEDMKWHDAPISNQYQFICEWEYK